MQCLKNCFRIVENKFQYFYKINQAYKRKVVTQHIVHRLKHNSGIELNDFEDNEEEKDLYMQLSHDFLGTATTGHKVFVVQPYIKWGRDKKRNTTPELQLAEAVALVNTLSDWYVVGTKCVPLLSLQKKRLLGSGALDTLKKDIQKSQVNVTAIFVSTNLLKFVQITELENALNLPIFDRYSIVIHIFRQHAVTTEAKLQVALAELPYIRKKMNELTDHRGGRINLHERKKKLLESREKKLKNLLKKLEVHRNLNRNQRLSYGFPSVAIVGYTNAGKTSLIQALTGDESLQPENKLFATLDTTIHQGILPCSLKVLFIDTIGFIQDVPEALVEPFKVTLEDAMIADIIVHVYDVSHPDVEAQIEHVQKTIRPMIDEKKIIINVANKSDMIEKDAIPEDAFAVSALKLTGIDSLRLEIEQKLLSTSGLITKRFRVLSGSLEASWLYKEATVINADPDSEDQQYVFLDAIMRPTTL